MENYRQVNISMILWLMIKSQKNKNFGTIYDSFDGTIVDNCSLFYQVDR